MSDAEVTWEQRMAERAHARALIAAARDEADGIANDPHRGHHSHLRGTMVVCSCGEEFGLTCVSLEGIDDLDSFMASQRCDECGLPGVSRLRG